MVIAGYIFLFLASILLIFSFVNFWDAPLRVGTSLTESLTTEELGDLEGKIKNLKEVIVIADNVEEPTSSLYDAVRKNLEKGVKYTFLISKRNFKRQSESYYSIFMSIAKAKKLEHLIVIKSLNIHWNEFPCIFYHIKDRNEEYFIAYLGNEKKEGIAEAYDFISPRMAKIFIKLAGKRSEEISREVKVGKILYFEDAKRKIILN